MKIIRTLFSVRFAALVLVACTLFTGVMYQRQKQETHKLRQENQKILQLRQELNNVRKAQREEEHAISSFRTHIDNELKLSQDVVNGRVYTYSLEKRLDAYEAAYPAPKGATHRWPKPTRVGELVGFSFYPRP
jgi:uncharacterized protein YlxW (UPF0749 family)